MFDWRKTVGFQWDAGNARKGFEKYDASQLEAEQLFLNQPVKVKLFLNEWGS